MAYFFWKDFKYLKSRNASISDSLWNAETENAIHTRKRIYIDSGNDTENVKSDENREFSPAHHIFV